MELSEYAINALNCIFSLPVQGHHGCIFCVPTVCHCSPFFFMNSHLNSLEWYPVCCFPRQIWDHQSFVMLLLSSYKQQILRVLLKLDSRKRGGQKYSIQKEKKQVDMVDILKLFCHGKELYSSPCPFVGKDQIWWIVWVLGATLGSHLHQLDFSGPSIAFIFTAWHLSRHNRGVIQVSLQIKYSSKYQSFNVGSRSQYGSSLLVESRNMSREDHQHKIWLQHYAAYKHLPLSYLSLR